MMQQIIFHVIKVFKILECFLDNLSVLTIKKKFTCKGEFNYERQEVPH